MSNGQLPGKLRNAWFALRRIFALRSTLQNTGVPNLVISPGGVGTTFLMRHLSGYIGLNDDYDEDRLKHIPYVPVDFLATKKILFITGSDDAIYSSIQRRGWVSIQGAKLGSLLVPLSAGKLQERAFRAAVRRQIARFRTYPPDRVLIVNYDDIWDNKETIQTFFGIESQQFVTEFPKRRARNSQPGAVARPV